MSWAVWAFGIFTLWLLLLLVIYEQFGRLKFITEEGQEYLMASVDDLQVDLDNIKALVAKQVDLIAQLVAASGGVPADVQAKIDALDVEAKAILASGAPPVV